MISDDRISRKHRPGRFKNRKALIAYLLAIILLALVIVVILKGRVGEIIEERIIKKMISSRPPASADSLALWVGGSFMLSNTPSVVDASRGDSGVVSRVIQPWPSGLSMMVYANRLKRSAVESGFRCECVEFGNNDSLLCELISAGSGSTEILLLPDKKTRLEKRGAGIIYKNLYKLENSEITGIIEKGIPFGYLADLEVFPAGEIRKRLQSRWISSILSIPAGRETLAQLNPVKGKKGKPRNAPLQKSEYSAFASDLLDRYPNLAMIEFRESSDPDYLFIEALLDQAKEERVDYIYSGDSPDRTDSLAYGSGLTFIDEDRITDYSEAGLSEIQKFLLSDLVESTEPLHRVAVVDISKVRPKDMQRILDKLRTVGVNILYINKLSDLDEFIVKDL
jgi:hypothetical protein